MTILAGIIRDERVYIATDSLISWGETYTRPVQTQGKFVETPNKDLIVAYCGSIKISQVMHHILNEIEHKHLLDVIDYKAARRLATTLKEELKEWGVGAPAENDLIEHNHGFLIAHKGVDKIFEIDSDYSIIEYDDYTVQGSGYQYADGAIQVLMDYDIKGDELLEAALKATISRDPSCGGEVWVRDVEV